MQSTSVKSLGFKLTKQVPDSVDEFDRLAKEQGAALREANRNILYRSTLADFRSTLLHGSDEEKDSAGNVTRPKITGLEEVTGVKRKTKVTKPEQRDDAGKVTQEEVVAWDESEDDYATRLWAELAKRGDYASPEAAQAAFESQAQSVLDAIPFDPSKTERKSAGPKKTPATYVDTAKAIVEAMGGSLEKAVEAFNKKNIAGITLAANATLDDLAAAVWKDQAAKKKQIAQGYAA